jgi:hypothetical protein
MSGQLPFVPAKCFVSNAPDLGVEVSRSGGTSCFGLSIPLRHRFKNLRPSSGLSRLAVLAINHPFRAGGTKPASTGFRRFSGVFARPEHPVTPFVAGLQWLNAGTPSPLKHRTTSARDVGRTLQAGGSKFCVEPLSVRRHLCVGCIRGAVWDPSQWKSQLCTLLYLHKSLERPNRC